MENYATIRAEKIYQTSHQLHKFKKIDEYYISDSFLCFIAYQPLFVILCQKSAFHNDSGDTIYPITGYCVLKHLKLTKQQTNRALLKKTIF